MNWLNVEIKARCADPAFIRSYLLEKGAEFKGIDIQKDTYFNSKTGRLKLRQGNIENNLIYYERPDQAGPKQSNFMLLEVPDQSSILEILSRSNGVLVVVEKKREIYYLGNVKFHIDEVRELGAFVEIEAGNMNTDITPAELKSQCDLYLKEFRIDPADLIHISYSDMLLMQG